MGLILGFRPRGAPRGLKVNAGSESLPHSAGGISAVSLFQQVGQGKWDRASGTGQKVDAGSESPSLGTIDQGSLCMGLILGFRPRGGAEGSQS